MSVSFQQNWSFWLKPVGRKHKTYAMFAWCNLFFKLSLNCAKYAVSFNFLCLHELKPYFNFAKFIRSLKNELYTGTLREHSHRHEITCIRPKNLLDAGRRQSVSNSTLSKSCQFPVAHCVWKFVPISISHQLGRVAVAFLLPFWLNNCNCDVILRKLTKKRLRKSTVYFCFSNP